MKCNKCKCLAVKNGKQKNGRQRYYCKTCKISFQRAYKYNAYNKQINRDIVAFLKESVGINATSRLLKISKTTVLTRILKMASNIIKPKFNEHNQYYEIDEMRVIVGYKQNQAWLTYGLNRNTKQIINFVIGRRTKENIALVTNTILLLNPKRVYTDRLSTYKSLIPRRIHNTRKKNTTIIERNNLTLRTNLKRLSRKTICYSKNFIMLEAILKIYIWGNVIKYD